MFFCSNDKVKSKSVIGLEESTNGEKNHQPTIEWKKAIGKYTIDGPLPKANNRNNIKKITTYATRIVPIRYGPAIQSHSEIIFRYTVSVCDCYDCIVRICVNKQSSVFPNLPIPFTTQKMSATIWSCLLLLLLLQLH